MVSDKDKLFNSLHTENNHLKEREIIYKSLLQHCSEGIICLLFESHQIIDSKSSIEVQALAILENAIVAECNEIMASMYGIKNKDQILGMKLKNISTSFNLLNAKDIRMFVESGYKCRNFETTIKDESGNVKFFINNLFGVIIEEKLVAVWGTQREITDRKISEETLIVLNEKVKEQNLELGSINDEKDNFIYSVTHDLNAPISNVEGLLNILKLDPNCSKSDTKEYIDLMDGAIAKFKSILRKIADDSAKTEK